MQIRNLTASVSNGSNVVGISGADVSNLDTPAHLLLQGYAFVIQSSTSNSVTLTESITGLADGDYPAAIHQDFIGEFPLLQENDLETVGVYNEAVRRMYEGKNQLAQKIADLSGVEDKAAARDNLDVYNREETTNSVREQFDVDLRTVAKPTLDLNFAKNEYTVWKGISEGFTKVPFAEAVDFSRSGDPKTGFSPIGKLEETDPDGQVLTYDPATGAPLGLSVHLWGTNFFLHSNDLTDSYWEESQCDIDLSPSDITNKNDSMLTAIDTSGETTTVRVRSPISLPDEGSRLFWAIVKPVTHSRIQLTLASSPTEDGSESAPALFELSGEGEVLSQSGDAEEVSSGIIRLSNNYYLVWTHSKVEPTETRHRRGMISLTNPEATIAGLSTSIQYDFDGTESIAIAHMQGEIGTYPSPAIFTEESQVTRGPDSSVIKNIHSLISKTTAVFILESRVPKLDLRSNSSGGDNTFISWQENDALRVYLREQNEPDNALRVTSEHFGAFNFFQDADVGEKIRVVVRIQPGANGFSISANGSVPSTRDLPDDLDLYSYDNVITLGGFSGSSAGSWGESISLTRLSVENLTDDEIQKLSSL